MSDTPDTTLQVLGIEPFYVSPTIRQLPKNLKPKISTLCEVCPASVWFATEKGAKCFCRVMHLVTWSADDPNALTHCDGKEMAEAAAIAKAEAG